MRIVKHNSSAKITQALQACTITGHFSLGKKIQHREIQRDLSNSCYRDAFDRINKWFFKQGLQ